MSDSIIPQGSFEHKGFKIEILQRNVGVFPFPQGVVIISNPDGIEMWQTDIRLDATFNIHRERIERAIHNAVKTVDKYIEVNISINIKTLSLQELLSKREELAEIVMEEARNTETDLFYVVVRDKFNSMSKELEVRFEEMAEPLTKDTDNFHRWLNGKE
jgi:hypothetical protein